MEVLARGLGSRNEIVRNRAFLRLPLVAMAEPGLSVEDVDDALEAVPSANRQLDGNCTRTEPSLDLLHDTKEICTGTIHFIDEN